jgi:serine/threonine-protein kinase
MEDQKLESSLAATEVRAEATLAPLAADAGRTLPAGSDGAAPLQALVTGRPAVLPTVTLGDGEPTLGRQGKSRFEIVRPLGEGGIGEVWCALDNDIGRQVALKRLRADVDSPLALLRFVEEIRTIGRLEHANIVPIHDVGVDEQGRYYFVMKLVDGETLESVIARLAAGDPEYHRRYGFTQRAQLFRELLRAVAFAHARGIIHRDIKPGNVMVSSAGEVLLMDWGLAKSLRSSSALEDSVAQRAAAGQTDRVFETQLGAVIGTPAYMSPEQARGAPLDERSDIYSLCVLFHELLYLRHYLAGKQGLAALLTGVLEQGLPGPSKQLAECQPPVPMDLYWYLRDGLTKEREHRYPSVEAMIERLDRRSESLIPIRCHVTFIKRATGEWLRFVDRHPLLMSIVAAGTVLTGVAGIGYGLWRLLS